MGWSVEVQVQSDVYLGFPEFTDPDYKCYATLLDGISDLDVLFDDDPLKLEWPPSKRFKHCAYAEKVTSAASALKDVTDHTWFGPITTSAGREKAVHGVIPSNTKASTHWAVKNFKLQATNRSAINPSDPVPAESYNPNLVCRRLRRYVMETRREADGHLYSPSTLRSLSNLFVLFVMA